MLPTKFRFIWPSSFRGEDFFKSPSGYRQQSTTQLQATASRVPLNFRLQPVENHSTSGYRQQRTTQLQGEKKVIVLFLRQKVVKCFSQLGQNRISGVMVSVLTWSAVDHGFKPRSGQTKDYKIGMCCFSAKHVALRRKGNDWLARNQNIMTEWSDMSTSRLFFH